MNFLFSLLLVFAAEAPTSPSIPCYEVQLGGEVITCLQHGLGSISAESRSEVVSAKLKQVAEDYSLDPALINVSESEGSYIIAINDLSLISLRPRDLAPNDAPLEDQALHLAEKIKSAISQYRAERRPEALLWALVFTILATTGLVLALKLMSVTDRFLRAKAEVMADRHIDKLKIKSYQLIQPYRIKQLISGFFWIAKALFVIFLLYVYIPLELSFFPWTAPWAPKIIDTMLSPVKEIGGVIIDYIPNIFKIVVILAITHFLLKFIKLIFREIQQGHIQFSGFHQDWARPTFKLVQFFCYAIALVMIFPYLPGSSSPAFQGLSVFLGVLISFGSGSAIANIIAGVVLTYMRPFRLGDRVKIADTIGDIVEKNFLVTKVKTIKNVDITIPNSMVLGSHIINYSSSAKEQGLILNTTVTVGYEVPWDVVHKTLITAAQRTEQILKDKTPFILQTALHNNSVAYELNAYTANANAMAQIYSDLHRNIQDAFNEAGIELLTPHYTALRDGNDIHIPPRYLTPDHQPKSFQVRTKASDSPES